MDVPMDAYGLLNNVTDASRVAPLQPWALALYQLRQRAFLQRDPMFLACKPPGGPRQFQQIHGFQFVEQPDFKRVFVLLGGGNRNRRIIYTDGRKHLGQLQGNDDNPLFYGLGVGRWEGDSFVVDCASSTRSSGSTTVACRTPSSCRWSSGSHAWTWPRCATR